MAAKNAFNNIYEDYLTFQGLYDTIQKIAMEAPGEDGEAVDIRQMTNDEMSSMEGEDETNLDEDPETDDPGAGGEEDPGTTEGEEEEPLGEDTDDTGDEEGTGDVGEEDPPEEEAADDTGTNDDQASRDKQVDYQMRLNIHKNTLNFLSVVENSKESFEQRYGHDLTIEKTSAYHTIMKCFEDLVAKTKTTLSKKFMTSDYQQLTKFNVALNRSFDVIARMVKNYVDQFYTQTEEKNKK